MKFQIVSDSSCDLGRERAQRLGVTLVSYYVSMDGQTYYREERDITAREFYRQMADRPGVFPRTSMPTIEDYLEAFRPPAERGEAVLCICLNEPFSGSIQSARNAREELLEEFPQARIQILDSQLATVLQGLLVLEAAHMRDAGFSLEDTVAALERTKTTGRIFFTTNDLEYLRHGGRIGRAAAATGALLRVKPLIGYEGNGLVSDGIAPGRKNSLNRVMELFYRYLARRQIDLRGYYLAMHMRDRFSFLVTAGITTLLAMQVILNVAVVTNLLPCTGISLPFFSYGGTALLIQMAEMGIILSASREIPAKT